MSLLGYYFVESTLREAGWPRKQGLLGRAVYDTTVVDAAIDQMVSWAASLGAGRPNVALHIIADVFRDRDWKGNEAPEIKVFIDGSRDAWDDAPNASPQEIVQPIHLRDSFGATVSLKGLQSSQVRMALEQHVLEAVLWGLANPERFIRWYAEAAQKHQSRFGRMQSSGLAVDGLPPLNNFLDASEQIVRNYEGDVAPLPPIPPKLLADASALGVKVNKSN